MWCWNDWKFSILKLNIPKYWSNLGAICKIGGRYLERLMVCSGGGSYRFQLLLLSRHSDAPGDSWLNFFLGLSPKGTWIPGGMKCNPIFPSYPPSCFAVNLVQVPQPALAAAAPPLAVSCASVVSPCVLAGELGSCPVRWSLVLTSLFLQFFPEDALN